MVVGFKDDGWIDRELACDQGVNQMMAAPLSNKTKRL